MNSHNQEVLDKYERYFVDIFGDLIKKIDFKEIEPSLSCVQGCKTGGSIKRELYYIKISIIQNLQNKLDILPINDKIHFLNIINSYLEDLKDYKGKNIILDKTNPENPTNPEYKDKTIISPDSLIKLYNDFNAFERIVSETYDEIKIHINELIENLKSQKAQENKPEITWEGTDTDFLELVTALVESKKIKNQTKELTRTDAIRYFECIFNKKIKSADSLLSHATGRKNAQAPFLESLKQAFIDYCNRKDEKDLPKK